MDIKTLLNEILDNEFNPFGYMDLEYFVILYQINNDFVYRLVHLVKFLTLIYFLFEYLLLHILSHKKK